MNDIETRELEDLKQSVLLEEDFHLAATLFVKINDLEDYIIDEEKPNAHFDEVRRELESFNQHLQDRVLNHAVKATLETLTNKQAYEVYVTSEGVEIEAHPMFAMASDKDIREYLDGLWQSPFTTITLSWQRIVERTEPEDRSKLADILELMAKNIRENKV